MQCSGGGSIPREREDGVVMPLACAWREQRSRFRASPSSFGLHFLGRATRNIFRLLGLLILITLLIFNSLRVGLEFLARHYHQ
ncbi:hypothetical protein RIF29_05499 [Crotalaria pallida]|uniref:Uncharacterized protein n=1 Tax=Crotalaria pallida TaxID=3830 RepID=A0AAN9PAC5_CROPI